MRSNHHQVGRAEKILELLTTLTNDMAVVKTDIADLKVGQTVLEVGQAETNSRLTRLETRIEDIHSNLAVLEAENKEAHGALFDKWDLVDKKADILIEQQPIVENQLGNHDLRLKSLERHVLAG